jgi:3-keto-5-aminohexanoate cleavage enzyme
VSQKFFVTAAVNGAEVTRAQFPALPITPSEVADEARRCADEGASILHLHGRLPSGQPTQDLETFRAYFAAVRERTDIIVQFSTGGAIGMGLEERIEALCLCPEMATLTTGTCNFGDDIFANSNGTIRAIAERLRQFGVKPELEVFDLGMLDTAIRLHAEGVLKGRQHVDFVLGVPGAMAAEASHLRYLVSRLPADWCWSVAGVGRHELPMARVALELGGHVRVGIEDNIYLSRGVLAAGSFELVAAVVAIGREVGRDVMSIEETRALLGLDEVKYPCG